MWPGVARDCLPASLPLLRQFPRILLVFYSLKLFSLVVCWSFPLPVGGLVFVSIMTEVSLLVILPRISLPCLGMKELINALFRCEMNNAVRACFRVMFHDKAMVIHTGIYPVLMTYHS